MDNTGQYLSRGYLHICGVHQVQGLDLHVQRKMLLGSYLEYGMKRGAALVLTNESFDIWCIRWRILAGRKG